MQRFVLIDGNAIVHRAFHAYPSSFTSKDGQPVNAIYGFFAMFLKIMQDTKPSYITVCFDRPKPTFRQQLYVGYQAQRPKMEDGLGDQFGVIHKMLEEVGVQIFGVDGYEADDLIGTIATRLVQKTENRGQKTDSRSTEETDKTENYSSVPSDKSAIRHPLSVLRPLEVIIVSGDRDLLQLVNSHVKMLAPVTGITNMTLFDAQKVEEKYGLKPSQFIDYKALVGDASDNYPGVTGIGPKTASDLLKKYETFENVYQHLPELSQKVATALATDAEQAALAKKLATIVTDVPIQFELKKCGMDCFDMAALRKEFEKLGFNSLLKRLEETKESQGTSGSNGKKRNGNVPKQLGLL